MIANLMDVAGVTHVITIDLHASQMQGFFQCPVDNLVAEPILAKWIRNNITDWPSAVVVSKNPGGTKRVTSLADALQLNFGIITTERRRMHMPASMYNSVVFNSTNDEHEDASKRSSKQKRNKSSGDSEPPFSLGEPATPIEHDYAPLTENGKPSEYFDSAPDGFPRRAAGKPRVTTSQTPGVVDRLINGAAKHLPSPLAQSIRPDSSDGESRRQSLDGESSPGKIQRMQTVLGTTNSTSDQVQPDAEDDDEEFTDEVNHTAYLGMFTRT